MKIEKQNVKENFVTSIFYFIFFMVWGGKHLKINYVNVAGTLSENINNELCFVMANFDCQLNWMDTCLGD